MNRHAIIVPVSIVAQCNQVAVFIGIDPEARLDTMSVPLVPLNGSTVTHYGASGKITEEQRQYLEEGFVEGVFPGALWWRWDNQTGLLVASHDGQHIGEVWSWERSLTMAGRKVQPVTLS